MCGITGFVGLDNKELLRAMCESLTHRGPDESGYHIEPGVGLAMRRLAVIDLTTGSQPITNETRDVWVVFNGEIYNYQDLRTQLRGEGHVLKTTSDTETIVHLYEDYGLNFIKYLRGMFGVAIWDSKQHRLVLARDRIGEKPLYYAEKNNNFYFGSEIKAILQAWNNREVDRNAVCEFLAAGYVSGSKTFFKGISKLQPGEMLIWEDGKSSRQRYWRHNIKRNVQPSFSEAAQELADRLSDTVLLCLKSDVEVGAFLSGGIDSSVIVALMRQHEAQVQTFSVGYEGEAAGFNELHYARVVAERLGTNHHELILGPQSNIELLPRILWHYDEPHGEPTSVLVYLLCEFTRRRVKVAVGGTGGDELFFGYPRHKGLRLLEYYSWLPKVLRKQLIEKIVSRWPESTKGNRFSKRAKRFIKGAELAPEHAYLSWVRLLQPEVLEGLVSERVRREADDPSGDQFLRDHLLASDEIPLLDKVASLDIEEYLPEYQLAYMDRMSMAHGLEVRSPFCDYQFVEYSASLPTHFRLRRTRSKHILKEVAKRWIPARIAERPKVGFDSPIGQWFKTELRGFLTSFLSADHVRRSGLLNPGGIQNLMNEHLSGHHDYSLQLWSIVALEGWYRMYIEDGVKQGNDYKVFNLRGADGQKINASGF